MDTTAGSLASAWLNSRAVTPVEQAGEDGTTIRPARLADFIGQAETTERLRVAIDSAKARGAPLDHTLIHAPPGLGKTTLAKIAAVEMGARLVSTAGPAIGKIPDLLGLLLDLKERDVLFVDEIHALDRSVGEYLYQAMDDFSLDVLFGQGMDASAVAVPIPPFTLIGATTRAGRLPQPLRDRFGLHLMLRFYRPIELVQITTRSARALDVAIDAAGAAEVARRARGTPRIANRLLRRVRDFALARGRGVIDRAVVQGALSLEGIDAAGLDALDRHYLQTLIERYDGGPAGLNAIAASMQQDAETLGDAVEPYLLFTGLIVRASRGRRVTAEGKAHWSAWQKGEGA